MEDPNRHTPQWKSTLGKHIRDKVHFDMQPTDPQNDIGAQATVNYGTGRSILLDHLQYKRQHMPVSNTTHLANRHKQRTG